MRKIMLGLAAIVIAFAAGTMSAPAAGARSAAAEAFWKCSTGFAFETSGNAVHCKKAPYTDRRSLAGCPIGLYPYTDRSGNKDMCSATNLVTGELGVERACKPSDVVVGYTKRHVDGLDFCGKYMLAEIRAPTVVVNLTVN
ncbi:MAG TPA: hypothetical protein VJB15_11275 [Rhodothermia bacterium]|nr:hypothetical protein [Rhodothermia bacterium]